MRNRKILYSAIAVAVLALIGLALILNKPEGTTSTNQQTSRTPQPQTEQTNEPSGDTEEEFPMELDINTQQFTLTGSNVSCSTTTVNGQTSHNCTGTIHIVPLSNQAHDPALYKINEQTQLLHDGQPQDLQTLQQLSQNRTTVRLKMADNSSDTIAAINY